ncbi:MAG TPA: hypothetical protein VFU47_07895 [Armatimonadota bacterium]|nr:hypothetical protein [Armatimonadota bacterium]
MTAGERARALITAQVNGDEDGQRAILEDVATADLPALAGALLAMSANLVQVVAVAWDADAPTAWAALLSAERKART